MHQIRDNEGEGLTRIGCTLTCSDDGEVIRSCSYFPTDIEEIRTDGSLSEEFRIFVIFEGDDPCAEGAECVRDFFGIEFLFLYQYCGYFIISESEFPQGFLTQSIIKFLVIIVCGEDPYEGLLRESERVEIGEEMSGHKEMFLVYDINLGVFLFETEFAECFLCIIPLISDKPNHFCDIALGESDRTAIGLFVEVSDHFSLEKN